MIFEEQREYSRVLADMLASGELDVRSACEQITLLIVDDVPMNLHINSAIFRKLGFKVMSANSGPEAIKIAQGILDSTGRLDLVLMDIQMPDMDGYEATLLLRQLFAPTYLCSTQVMALTACDSVVSKSKMKDSGMIGSIPKPFNPEEVSREICIAVLAAEPQEVVCS